MKKATSMFLLCCMIISFTFTASAVEITENNMNMINAQQDALEDRIQMLYDERSELLNADNPDMTEIGKVEAEMRELGVEFLSYEQVVEQFPEAVAATTENSIMERAGTHTTVPSSSVNSWSTYRVSNYYYEGQYFNIQKLVAEPISESSSLWEEEQIAVNFSTDWNAITTNLLEIIAGAAMDSFTEGGADVVITVYDAVREILEGMTSTTVIKPSEVIYWYETQTTAVFCYTKIEGRPDSTQVLNHISTKCKTSVGYLFDIEKYKINGSSDWIVEPAIASGSYLVNHTPTNYSSSAWAAYMYLYDQTLARFDTVDYIKLKGPENRTVYTIYPCKPQFPAHCE